MHIVPKNVLKQQENQLQNITISTLLPYATKRNITTKTRITYLEKKVYKKLKYWHSCLECSKTFLQNTKKIYNNFAASSWVLDTALPTTLFQNLIKTYAQKISLTDIQYNMYTTYLEIINNLLKISPKILKPHIKYLFVTSQNLKISKIFNNLQINTQKTTLYSSQLAESNQKLITQLQQNNTLIAQILILQAYLLQIPVILLQYSTYPMRCQKYYISQNQQTSNNKQTNQKYLIPQCQKPPKIGIPLYLIDQHLTIYYTLQYLHTNSSKNNLPYLELLPKYYKKPVKNFLKHYSTVQHLAKHIKSTNKAKKILRIMHKRLQIYTHKKPKWILP